MNDERPSGEARASDKPERRPPTIKPVKRKVGETRDNLRRREAWYQRRAGGQRRSSST